jgi:hypothetical protein
MEVDSCISARLRKSWKIWNLTPSDSGRRENLVRRQVCGFNMPQDPISLISANLKLCWALYLVQNDPLIAKKNKSVTIYKVD